MIPSAFQVFQVSGFHEIYLIAVRHALLLLNLKIVDLLEICS